MTRTALIDADVVTDESLASIPPEEFHNFAALCTKAATIAAQRARPVVVSWTFAAPHLTVADRVRHLSTGNGRRTFVWASAWTGQRRLAVGTALDIPGHGPGGFDQLSKAWSWWRNGAVVGGTGRGPALVGGFRFDAGESPARTLPDAMMWLPAAELTEAPGCAPEVTLNAWIGCSTAVGGALRQAQSAVRALLRDSTFDEPRQELISLRETPSASDWRQLVQRALAAIERGSFEKVVLARQMLAEFDRPVAIAPMLGSLIEQHRAGAVFGAQLGNRWFVGRTPECLMHLDGERAETHGLAGSLPRDQDPVRDGQLCNRLLTDPKLEREHAIVADYIKATLRRHFRDVRTNTASAVLKLTDIQHLQTGISATKPIFAPDLLRLAGALHPTPAVGGFPSAPALRWLAENEPFERDWYAAPIGWVGADGGELAVGIRSALIRGSSAVVYAGCGIVKGSSPEDEYQETCVKMRQMLAVLGVDEHEMAA